MRRPDICATIAGGAFAADDRIGLSFSDNKPAESAGIYLRLDAMQNGIYSFVLTQQGGDAL